MTYEEAVSIVKIGYFARRGGVVPIIVSISVYAAWLVAVLSVAKSKWVNGLRIVRRLAFVLVASLTMAIVANLYVSWCIRNYQKNKPQIAESMPRPIVAAQIDKMAFSAIKDLIDNEMGKYEGKRPISKVSVPSSPAVIPKPVLGLAFYSADIDELSKTEKPETATDNVIPVELTVVNKSDITANNIKFWVRVCSTCEWAAETAGLAKTPGIPVDDDRSGSINFLVGNTITAPFTIKVRIRPDVGSFQVGFFYTCDTCAPLNPRNPQNLVVEVMRPVHYE